MTHEGGRQAAETEAIVAQVMESLFNGYSVDFAQLSPDQLRAVAERLRDEWQQHGQELTNVNSPGSGSKLTKAQHYPQLFRVVSSEMSARRKG